MKFKKGDSVILLPESKVKDCAYFPKWGGKYGYIVGRVDAVTDTAYTQPVSVTWQNGKENWHDESTLDFAPESASTDQHVPDTNFEFQIGDRVILTGDKRLDAETNPIWGGKYGRVVGTVFGVGDPYLPTRVKWDNGKVNSYMDSELSLAAEPMNLSQHAPGAKLDDNKTMWHLLPWRIIDGVAKVATFGAKKYTTHGWQSVPDGKNRYFSAMMRHWSLMCDGVHTDDESGLPHWAHFVCNAVFIAFLHDKDTQFANATCEKQTSTESDKAVSS
jgi:ribosomal protein L21E